MTNTDLFSRYSEAKRTKFAKWLKTPHGQQVYKLFRQFAERWRDAGYSECSAALIINRIRWECAITAKYQGYKITNDYGPMLARQLATDDPTYATFFSFHHDQQDHHPNA